jgi:2-(1,2-epoxy-1,2-dihydrophenyl)acetyl-CoA isomerase
VTTPPGTTPPGTTPPGTTPASTPIEPSGRVRLEIADGLAQLWLARPEARNGIDLLMVQALSAALDVVTGELEQGRVRALLIAAEGPAFTVGGDLRHLAGELDRLPDELRVMIDMYHSDVLTRLAELPVPVLAAAHGAAAGGGLGLLWVADAVVAADDLRIATGFVHLALSGDGGSSWHLPRLVGLARARELIIGGRVLDAAEAYEWGLVGQVVPAAELADTALERARALAAGPTYALARMKRLLHDSSTSGYREQLTAERDAIVDCARTGDAAEGIRAFGERRAPGFSGR